MVFREDSDGLIIITQPAHSWISGQLARHWGNAESGGFAPREEVCLAAEQHDIGFLSWEKSPTLNTKTGWPHDFLHMPTGLHLDLWAVGVQKLTTYSRYAALLVSLHVTHLCQNNKVDKTPRAAQAAQGFLDQQRAVQSNLLPALLDDLGYAPYCSEVAIKRNRLLIAAWDWMSLVFCQGKPGETVVNNVPWKEGTMKLKLCAAAMDPAIVSVSPWPFSTPAVELVCDGRRVPQTYTNERKMRIALRTAPAVTIRTSLRPG